MIITPYNAQVFEIQQQVAERPCGHCRQVSGPTSCDRNLFDGNVKPCGRAARYGIPLQPQPAERRDLPRQVHIGHCRLTTNCRSRMPDAPANTISQRVLPVLGNGNANAVGKHLYDADTSTIALSTLASDLCMRSKYLPCFPVASSR